MITNNKNINVHQDEQNDLKNKMFTVKVVQNSRPKFITKLKYKQRVRRTSKKKKLLLTAERNKFKKIRFLKTLNRTNGGPFKTFMPKFYLQKKESTQKIIQKITQTPNMVNNEINKDFNKIKQTMKFKISVVKGNKTKNDKDEIENNYQSKKDKFSKKTENTQSKIKNNKNELFDLFKDNTISTIDNNSNNFSTGRWNEDEHKRFIEAIIQFGNDWKEVQKYIGTRSSSQARSHAQKFFIKLKRDQQKSKISGVIDYSNSSIKIFHDALMSLEPTKKEKIIEEMGEVHFNKTPMNLKRKRRRTNTNNINNNLKKNLEENEMSDCGFMSGTDFMDEDTLNMMEGKNRKEEYPNGGSFYNSVLAEIDESENCNTINLCDDEEYEKSFHMVFSSPDHQVFNAERKQSIQDDFIFNSLKLNN